MQSETPTPRKYQRRPRAPDLATEDPTLSCYLKICFVCKEEAKAGDQHTNHYGGIVCLSCRAFFRRSHQTTKTPNFRCKKKGNCYITKANRRRCQHCRYRRCIRAGMNPDAVLTDDQKKVRFRKVLAKKSQKDSRTSSRSVAGRQNGGGDSDEVKFEDDSQEESDNDDINDMPWPEFEPPLDFSPVQAEEGEKSPLVDQSYPLKKRKLAIPQFGDDTTTWYHQNPQNEMQVTIYSQHNFQEMESASSSIHLSWPTDSGSSKREHEYPVWNNGLTSRWASSYQSFNDQVLAPKRKRTVECTVTSATEGIPEVKTEIEFPPEVKIEPAPTKESPPRQYWLHPREEDSCGDVVKSDDEELPVVNIASRKKIETLLKTHFMAIRQMETPSYSKIMKKLACSQAGDQSAFQSLTREELLVHMVNMSQRFRHFALLQRSFCRLSKSDQRQLLARNSALYIHLYMGCFFGASGVAQQKELVQKYQMIVQQCEGEDKSVLGSLADDDTYINMQQFNDVTRLFREDADLEQYVKLIEVFKKINLSSLESRAIMSYLVLFDYDSSLKLTSHEVLRRVDERKEELYKKCFPSGVHVSLNDMMATLVRMAVFGAYHIQWDDIVFPSKPRGLTCSGIIMPYTKEEDAWVSEHIKIFDEQFSSVPLGEEILKEAIMTSLGVPLSKNFMPVALAVLVERLKRILRGLPFLSNLIPKHFLAIEPNIGTALGLIVAKLELCSSGFEQIDFIYSLTDKVVYRDIYLPLFSTSRDMSKITMEMAVTTSSVQLQPDDLKLFNSSIQRLRKIFVDPTLFKMIIMIILTQPSDICEEPCRAVVQLHYQLVMVLRRKLESQQIPGITFSNIMSALKDAEKIRGVLSKIRKSSQLRT